jgi:hypothetical protein
MRHARFLRICFVTVLLCSALAAHAQGCSMCRDTTAGSAPQIRAGLRRAIPVLALPAIALFIGFFVVARRTDAWLLPEVDTWHRIEESQPIDEDR